MSEDDGTRTRNHRIDSPPTLHTEHKKNQRFEPSDDGGRTAGRTRHTSEGEDLDPDLARIVTAWPNLPAPIKAAMLALVGVTPLVKPI